jgi:hypothetical protein
MSVGIGSDSHASVPLSRRPSRGRVTKTNVGVSADLAYTVDDPLRYFARFGTGVKKKQKMQIALRFMFYATRSS